MIEGYISKIGTLLKLKQQIKVFFFLLLSFLTSAQAFSYEGDLRQSSPKFFYGNTSSFPLKNIGFLRKDSEYYISPLSSHTSLIVSEEFDSFFLQWSEYQKRIDRRLLQLFKLQPYFRESYLFFSSPRRQVSNALATVYPFPFVQIYPSGSVDFMDRWSLFSWSQDTLLHEMTHIYQLSQNSKWDRILWPILGAFSYRNILLPSWVLEGSAVLVESLYGSGGRLFSGFVRAFVFSQLKEEFSLKRLLKPYNDTFSGTEKYLHGAYFFNYLHSQYGLKEIKQLFHESSRFFPLDYYGLNSSLRRAFKKDLLTLFEEYKSYYKNLAQKQQSFSGPVLAKSKVYVPMNSDESSIYFLISDSKSPSQLLVFDKKTGVIKKTKKNLPMGKVFYKGGEYYSSASLRTSNTSVEYSLVKEDFKPIKQYNSQNVMDFYKGKAIAIDARQNHTGNSLIIDKAFYDTVDSSALADAKGAVYYFKQNKEYRTLYKNKKALTQFKSYFSYPVEVNEKAVYFIGAVKYGSSLFVYKKDLGIYRLSESDTIVSARQIKDNRFLVSEIAPNQYEYKVIETKELAEAPVLYQYSFHKENIFLKSEGLNQKEALDSSDLSFKAEPVISEKTEFLKRAQNSNQAGLMRTHLTDESFLKKSVKLYRPFSFLSLNQFFFSYVPEIQIEEESIPQAFSAFFKFLDPLQYNQLLLYNRWSENNKFINASYSYQKYRPSFGFSFLYEESSLDFKEDKYLIQTFRDIGFLDTKDIFYPVGKFLRKKEALFQRTWKLALSVSYPIYLNSESKLSFESQIGLGEKEFNKNKLWKSYISQSGQLKYLFKRGYSQAYSYHKKRELSVLYDFLHLKGKTQTSHSFLNGALYAGLTEELGQEYFLSLNGKVLLNLWNREPHWPQIKTETIFYCSDLKQAVQKVYHRKYPCPNKFKQSIHNLYQGNIELLKVLNYSYYPLKAPFSLRRLALLTGLSVFSAQDFSSAYRSFLVPFIGLEGELSLLHEKLIVKLGMSFENRIELFKPYKDSKFQLSFWLKNDL